MAIRGDLRILRGAVVSACFAFRLFDITACGLSWVYIYAKIYVVRTV